MQYFEHLNFFSQIISDIKTVCIVKITLQKYGINNNVCNINLNLYFIIMYISILHSNF